MKFDLDEELIKIQKMIQIKTQSYNSGHASSTNDGSIRSRNRTEASRRVRFDIQPNTTMQEIKIFGQPET